MKKSFVLFKFLLLVCASGFAQQSQDSIALGQIRNASKTNSSISSAIATLADINGPRLLGTSAYYRSAAWARQQLEKFGTDTAYLESFDSKYRGWNIKSFNMEMTSPAYMHIIAYQNS